ncbi:MAG: efflux transporter outer membrane subunit [Alphaproteobacteria bacterium]|nr:efflux transporter outer membrane subunit [Alphaproteobacteria bacterium]
MSHANRAAPDRRRVLWAAAVALALASCKAGPDYQRPEAPTPPAFKEMAGWKIAAPRDAAPRGAWWSVYRDPQLDALVAQVDVSNQTIKSAEAGFRTARALARSAAAAGYPTISAGAAAERLRRGSGTSSAGAASARARTTTGGGRAQNLYDASLDLAWEIDLWGRVRRAAEGASAAAQASAGDLEAARLSIQAELATNYFLLRAADAQRRILDASAVAYARSLEIARNRYAVGVGARADVLSAETQLETTRAQAIAVGVQRAQLEHAIAVLLGRPPAGFALAAAPLAAAPPEIPVEVPSVLLERRPDIAAAERRMAAANAQIGVAEAAFFPTITLSGSYGYTSTALGQLIQAANLLWSVGTQATATIFDGGARSAGVEQARAAYDQAVAEYRQTVLVGFQQVEDELAALRILAEQAEVLAAALRSAREAERLTLNQYRAGTAAYTSVITAQAAALADELAALNVQQARLVASVALIRALGGGWDAASLPAPDRLYEAPTSEAPAPPKPGPWSGMGTAIRNLFK